MINHGTLVGTDREPRFFPREEPVAADPGVDPSDSHLTNAPGWLTDSFGGAPTASGVRVTPDSGMRASTVFACVELRAGTLASVPLKLYRRVGEDRAPATDHPLYAKLHHKPNKWQTKVDWIFMLQAHTDLRGNSYSKKLMNGRGQVLQLKPLHPDRVIVRKTADDDFYYDWYRADGKVETLSSEEVVHRRGPSLDGDMGLSRISYAREVIGRDIAARDYGNRFFANDARPPIYLKHPKTLSKPAQARLREGWQERYGGANRFKGPAVLEEGLDVAQIGMTNDEAQFLDTMNFGVPDICRFFDVPPMMVGHDGKTMTHASAEVMLEMFKTLTMVEIALAWEQRLNADLLTERESEELFFEFELDGLVRGSLEAQGNYLAKAIGRPWMTADEGRRLRNLPQKGGNAAELANPLNMGGAGPKEGA